MAEGRTLDANQVIDTSRLAAILKALASPVRLDLLQALRSPRMLGEIRVSARRKSQSLTGSAMNRVSVRQHLDSLLRVGVVRTIPLHRDGRLAKHFVLDYGQLFALTEELRQIARLQVESGILDSTMPAQEMQQRPAPSGPTLVLVNGIMEGRAFALSGPPGQREWILGRGPDCDIVLEYDPYVSTMNSKIVLDATGFSVRDLPSSRNGTLINWQRLPKGQTRALSNGDVLSSGRSVMVFRQ